jgi:hypothetical protein
MANVRFVRTTKERWLNRDAYDPLALYFCEDTGEMFKGDQVYTDAVRVIPTKADLPACPCAADGIVYYVTETRNGYVMAPDRSEWLQTIYAPATDAYTVPESEIYNTVTTVGAVRDIEQAIYEYIDKEIASIEIGSGQGADGEDGKTPYIQNGYWYIDGVNTGTKAEGVDGKDGESAYEVWLHAGHSGSEDDFLQWLKGDTEPFGDVVTSIDAGGIMAGTSLKGKTVKDVLTMLLGIKEVPQSTVDYIIENNIPFYSGLDGGESSEIAYQQLDTATAEYTDQGFYTTTNSDGEITKAGYQMTFEGNTDGISQTFSMCATAKIITAYQYQPALNQWLNMGFDGTYWVENGTTTKVINGQEVTYTTYIYNTELMGDAINAPEYWRFEVEVL